MFSIRKVISKKFTYWAIKSIIVNIKEIEVTNRKKTLKIINLVYKL